MLADIMVTLHTSFLFETVEMRVLEKEVMLELYIFAKGLTFWQLWLGIKLRKEWNSDRKFKCF